MIHEELTNVISGRVKEVLQHHLNGTSEEFDAAANAVMKELSFMGGNLHNVVSFTGADITTDEGRTELASTLSELLKDQE